MGDDKPRSKRGTYNRYLRTDEKIPRSTLYAKRKLEASQYVDDGITENNGTSMSSLYNDDADNSIYESSLHFDEQTGFNDFLLDSTSEESSDNEDDDSFDNDKVKVNLENMEEPLYPSSSVTLLDAYITILAFSLRHNLTKICMQELLQMLNLLLPSSNLPDSPTIFTAKSEALLAIKKYPGARFMQFDSIDDAMEYSSKPVPLFTCQADDRCESEKQIKKAKFYAVALPKSFFETENIFYVPILRDLQNNIQEPVIGKPCLSNVFLASTSSEWAYGEKDLVYCAFTGPMSEPAADHFYTLLKKRKFTENLSFTPKQTQQLVDICLTDSEKGLERVGRKLAKELNVEWVEFWPTLQFWGDL